MTLISWKPETLQNQKHGSRYHLRWPQKCPWTKSKTCLVMILDAQPSPTQKCLVPNIDAWDFVGKNWRYHFIMSRAMHTSVDTLVQHWYQTSFDFQLDWKLRRDNSQQEQATNHETEVSLIIESMCMRLARSYRYAGPTKSRRSRERVEIPSVPSLKRHWQGQCTSAGSCWDCPMRSASPSTWAGWYRTHGLRTKHQ